MAPPPKIDHYLGRDVVAFEPGDGWYVELDGEIFITNEDVDAEIPDSAVDLVGTALLRSTTRLSDGQITLDFGYNAPPGSKEPPHIVCSLMVEPEKYFISEGEEGEPVYPEAPVLSDTPPEPPASRTPYQAEIITDPED